MRKKIITLGLFMTIALLAGGSMCRATEATKASQAVQWTFDKEQSGEQ